MNEKSKNNTKKKRKLALKTNFSPNNFVIMRKGRQNHYEQIAISKSDCQTRGKANIVAANVSKKLQTIGIENQNHFLHGSGKKFLKSSKVIFFPGKP